MNNLYNQAIEELFNQAPSYQVVGGAAYHPGMKVMEDFNEFLDYPSEAYDIIHIAGTNGKGSVSSMLCSVLMEAGYKVGLYTSPHLVDFRERIKINGEMIGQKDVLDFLELTKEFVNMNNPSFFEITTAMALWYFKKMEVDMVLLEVGLGGRLDSTNIVKPILTVITSISLDHCSLLGFTETEIAREKAGIMKEGVPMVVGGVSDSVKSVLQEQADKVGVGLMFSEEGSVNNLLLNKMDLKGSYQQVNLATVMTAIKVMRSLGYLSTELITEERLFGAIAQTAQRTLFRGRWECLSTTPYMIADIAHNEAGIRLTMTQLKELFESGRFGRLVIIFGMVEDKDLDKVLPLMPRNAEYIFTQAKGSRALSATKLAEAFAKCSMLGVCKSQVVDAMEYYYSISKKDDLVYIGGSSYVIAEVLSL